VSIVEATDKRTTKTRDTREPNESARTDNTKPTIELQWCGQHVLISPPVKQLQDEFYTVLHVTAPDEDHGYLVIPARCPLIGQTDVPYGGGEMCLHTFAGLEPLVEQWLEEHGYAVEKAGIRPKRLISPDTEHLQRVGHIGPQYAGVHPYSGQGPYTLRARQSGPQQAYRPNRLGLARSANRDMGDQEERRSKA